MNPHITLRTDASVKDGWGAGFAFEAEIAEEDGSTQSIQGREYRNKEMKTTDAEILSLVFGLKEVCKRIRNRRVYEIAIENDCKPAVEKVNGKGDSESMRIIRYLCKKFKRSTVRWIPRQTNKTADSLARNALERGFES